MGIEMPPNSLETLQALTKALPGKRAAGGPLPFNRREASNPWDNVPDQPLVRYQFIILTMISSKSLIRYRYRTKELKVLASQR
jgi:hypothetical protein